MQSDNVVSLNSIPISPRHGTYPLNDNQLPAHAYAFPRDGTLCPT